MWNTVMQNTSIHVLGLVGSVSYLINAFDPVYTSEQTFTMNVWQNTKPTAPGMFVMLQSNHSELIINKLKC